MYLSIVIPCHNYGHYIKDCIDSILLNDQKYILEIIIVNDSSIDNSEHTILQLKKKVKLIKYYKVNFKSLSKSSNYGISKSNSDYILKVDADDLIDKNFIKIHFNYLLKNDIDITFSNLVYFNKYKRKKIKQVNSNILYFFKYPVGSGLIYKKIVWEQLNGYDESLKFQDDLDFWIKIKKKKKYKIFHINQYIYYYRNHKTSMSKNFFKKYYIKFKIILKYLIKRNID